MGICQILVCGYDPKDGRRKKSPKELKVMPGTKGSKKGSERAIKWTKRAKNIVYVPKTPHCLSKTIFRLGGSTLENVYFEVILLGTLLYIISSSI